MEFKKDIKLELNDLLAFSYSKIVFPIIIFAPIFAIISLAINYLTEKPFILLEELLSTLVSTVITVALFALVSVFLLKRSQKKQYESNPILRASSLITINKEGFCRKNDFEQVFIKWNEIFAVYEVNSSYNIYVSKFISVLIPKRLLTPQEETTLRQLINENIDTKKNKLRKC